MVYLFPACLTLHLASLVLMAGVTLVDYLAYASFWKSLRQGDQSVALLRVINQLPRWIGIGAAALILTGVGMMALTRGVYGEQLWFRIKIGLVVLLIVNSLVVGRRLGLRMRKVADLPAPELGHIRRGLNGFHLSQLAIIALIIFLSVFKFN
jgi:uncharacterized membrane protein